MTVTREIEVTVEAESANQARVKARDWDIVGDEHELQTVSLEIDSVTKDD